MKTKTTQLNRLILLFFIFTFSFFIHVKAQGTITTVAGTPGTAGFSGNGGPATAAEIDNPMGLLYDPTAGFLYIADESNFCARKDNASTVEISMAAGTGITGYSGNGGPATSARFSTVSGFAIDRAGNLYIVDRGNDCIRIVSTSGIVTLYAGVRIAGFSGDGGPATSAELQVPEGAAVDASGNVYIADRNNNRIRKVNTSGIISTIAGNGFAGFSGDGSSATNAELDLPYKVAVDTSSNLYIADEANNRIRKVTISSGIISTIAGNGVASFSGDGGQATSAEIKGPEDVIFDKLNNMFIADALNERVRKVNLATGIISTVAGNGHGGFSGAGGPATSAELDSPTCVAIDSLNNLYLGMQTGEEVSYVVLWLRIIASATANVTCHGGTNGSASVTASLGTAPYTYSWAPGGGTSSTKTGLSAGSYSVYINDSHGVTGSTTVVITQPESPLTVSANTTANVTCYGGNNGSVTCTPSGGTMPYTYLWSSSVTATNQTTTGLSAGTYTIYLTDAHGCTATASTVVLQPAQLTAIVAQASNNKCAGATDGMALAAASGGIKPYTYSWAPTGGTKAEATGLGAGTYTVYITDAHGCTCSATDVISSPSALTITTTNISSLVYAATTGGIPPYTYTWTPGGSTTALLTGISAGTYTVVVEDANGCLDSVVVNETISVTIPNYSQLNHPRWSKRGVDVEFADTYYYPSDSLTIKGGALADYCAKNHITYVLLDGVYYDPAQAPYGAFNIDSASVDPLYGAALKNLIYMLKTRGHVEQIGVDVYPSDVGFHDTGSYAIKNFNVGNFVNSAFIYNIGLPWVSKLDYLSLDEEFWGMSSFTADTIDFYSAHLPMLQLMYKVAHGCDVNYLRVEDYIGPPLNPYNSGTNITQSREVDSICKYSDRILFSSYTSYPSVLWDRDDWVPAWQEIGRNPGNYYYKKEVWPIYDAANVNNLSCDTCYDGATNMFDFLGDSTCFLHTTSVNMEQKWFYQYYSNSMQNRLWTPDNLSTIPMNGDTCFEILGNAWYQYRCLTKLCHFDTLTYPSATDTVIPFWVTVGHDTNWRSTPIVLKATIHGGTPPYVYIWYNDNNGQLMQPPRLSSNNFDTLTVYSTGRIRVLAIDLQDSSAVDYLNIYNDTCFGPLVVPTISLPNYVIDLYPNPANNLITIEMAGNIGKQTIFELYDMIGQRIYKESFLGKKNTVNVNQLRAGMYFYRISSLAGKDLKTGKLEIVH